MGTFIAQNNKDITINVPHSSSYFYFLTVGATGDTHCGVLDISDVGNLCQSHTYKKPNIA